MNGNTNLQNNIIVAAGTGTRTIGSTAGATNNGTLLGTLTVNKALTLGNGAGTTAGGLNFAGAISGAGTITIDAGTTNANGNNSVKFNGNNAGAGFTSSVLINSGTLIAGNTGALGANNTVAIASGGALDVQNNVTIAGLNNNTTSGTVLNNNTSASQARALTVGGSGTYTFGGNITNGTNAQANTLALTVALTGSGSQTLTGNSTDTGVTAINGGKLKLGNGGNLGATAVTVSNSGSTFAIGQNATGTSNALAGSLSLGAGTAFTMADGFTSTFNVTGASTLAAASGSPTTLTFDIGGTTTATDLLAVAGAATVGAGTATISMNTVGSTALTTGVDYTIISAASGLGTSNFILGGATNVANGGSVYHFSLANSTAQAEKVTVVAGAVAATSAFWTGSQDSSWKTLTGNTTSNFTADAAGTTNTFALPDSNTNVTFTANTVANLSTTLDQNFTINSLAFSGTGTSNTAGTTIAAGSGTNTLTINAAALNGNTAGNGITVAAGSGANTISASVTLGAAQSWTNNSGSLLTVSGDVSNGANLLTVAGTGNTTMSGVVGGGGGLTKTGAGTLTLSNANNSYSGITTVSGGILSVAALANGGSNSSIGSSSNAATNLVIGGTLRYTGGTVTTDRTFTANAGGGIDVSNAATTLTFAGATVGGNTFTKSGPGSLTIAGNIGGVGGATISVIGGVATLQGSADNPFLAASVTSGILVLDKASSGSFHSLGGNSTVSGGTLKLAGSGGDQIFDNTTVTVSSGGTLDMGGMNEKVRSISGSGSVVNSGVAQSTLTVSGFSGNTVFGGVISGNVALTHSDGNSSTTLIGINTYSGDTNINSATATFNLSDNAGMIFYIGANGVNNKITSTTTGATVNLDGDFTFDLTLAGTGIGDTWHIVNVASLNETFSSLFTVANPGWTETADVWTGAGGNGAIYQFSEATGDLTVVPEPSICATLLGGMGLLSLRRRRRA